MIVKITEDVIYNIEKTQAFGKDVIGSRKIKIIKKHTVMKSMTTKCKCGKKGNVLKDGHTMFIEDVVKDLNYLNNKKMKGGEKYGR